MNFDFSDDERAMKDQARRFLAERQLRPVVRAMLDGGGGNAATELWNAVSEQGWPGLAIPEAYGGHGIGHVALCAIAEEAGRACAPLPLLPSLYLAAEALLLTGSEAQKQAWLPRIASGEAIGTAMLDHRDVAGTLVVEHGRLRGSASPVPAGEAAAVAIVIAREAGGLGLYLVDLAGPGVGRQAVPTIDASLPHAALSFDGAIAEPLGEAGAGLSLARRIEARAAVPLAFEQLGGADACLEMALEYARTRRSFGRLIGSYQAIKHKLADMYIRNELARSNAYYAAWALAADRPELELAAATARVSASEAFEQGAAENIQTHGGIGVTWEADPHLFYRRSRVLALALGPTSAWQQRLAGALATPLAA